jgi:hypothetical protein
MTQEHEFESRRAHVVLDVTPAGLQDAMNARCDLGRLVNRLAALARERQLHVSEMSIGIDPRSLGRAEGAYIRILLPLPVDHPSPVTSMHEHGVALKAALADALAEP